MKIKSIANGDVIEADADAASELIAAGIYAAADEKEEEKAPVAPLSTEDLPPQPKPLTTKAKPKKKLAREYKRRDMQAEKA